MIVQGTVHEVAKKMYGMEVAVTVEAIRSIRIHFEGGERKEQHVTFKIEVVILYVRNMLRHFKLSPSITFIFSEKLGL